MTTWKVAGINFGHMHMVDNLAMAHKHPDAEVVGVCEEDPKTSVGSIEDAVEAFDLPEDRVFEAYRRCLEATEPDIVVLCPPPAIHAEWVEKVAPYDVHVLVEKPFATSLERADRMIEAQEQTGNLLAINWPQVWQPAHRTSKRLVDEGTIGDVTEIHYFGGNSGPLRHTAGKETRSEEEVSELQSKTWFYDPDLGGGSLVDYLGYGATLGTWFRGGELPEEVFTMVNQPDDWAVDNHSVTVARYDDGLSKFETRWGTFTDPWEHQTKPKCGFVIVGEEGTIESDYMGETVTVQTADAPNGKVVPTDEISPPNQNPVQYLIHCLEQEVSLEGPLSTDLSRKGQRIADAALESSRRKSVVRLE